MGKYNGWVVGELERRGVSRREFMSFCAGVAAFLALPEASAEEVADTLTKINKPKIVWLEYQDCAGCTESFLRADHPTIGDIVLDVLSVDYHETIMAAAGHQAEAALDTATKNQGGYIAIIEGSIPTGASGAYCTIGGHSALELVRRIAADAGAVIAVGTCAAYGGLPAASPNPTGALGVDEAVRGLKALVNMPGCPVNADNLVALVVHYLTFGGLPALDGHKRPLFAYGKTIHDACERRAHFDAGQFVDRWGDEGHRSGYCLYKMGCKGPAAYHNCPQVRWNGATSWPVACGHPCLGCSEPDFWDKHTPFYERVTGYAGGLDVDRVGLIAAAAVGGGFVAHGAIRLASRIKRRPPTEPATAEHTKPEPDDEGDNS
jgi:hydrogenase small subunit